jgi:hypothetical protein
VNCRHTEGPRHDCRYVDARNELIDTADRIARREVERLPLSDGAKENRAASVFIRVMQELAKERGLVK